MESQFILWVDGGCTFCVASGVEEEPGLTAADGPTTGVRGGVAFRWQSGRGNK